MRSRSKSHHQKNGGESTIALLCPVICYESEDGRSAPQISHDGSSPSQQKQKAEVWSLTVVGVTKTPAKITLQDVERKFPRPLEPCISSRTFAIAVISFGATRYGRIEPVLWAAPFAGQFHSQRAPIEDIQRMFMHSPLRADSKLFAEETVTSVVCGRDNASSPMHDEDRF